MNMGSKNAFLRLVGTLAAVLLLFGCSLTAPSAPTPQPPNPPQPAPTALPVEPVVEPSAPTAEPALTAWQAIDAGRIQFEPNTTGWHTQGSLPAGSALKFVLNAARGQQMNIRLNYRYGQQFDAAATLYVAGADGTVFTPNPVTYFSQVLPTSQDYVIEIRSLVPEESDYSISIDIPAAVIDPALGEKYEPVDPSICQIIQESAAQGLGIEFYKDERAPFMDAIAGEAGQGCHVYASTDANKISDPWTALQALMSSAGAGWTEQTGYQAAGPTGFVTAMTRDMGLMKMEVGWKPAMGVACPNDQPISMCTLTPEQKVYAVNIDVAQYRADFSLDGHWEDTAAGFSLDLTQEWKNVTGKHTVVAQGGNKIDSLDVSISGLLQGQVVNLQFRSSFSDSLGRAQITYIDPNTAHWQIITPPNGEFYLPAEAALIRK